MALSAEISSAPSAKRHDVLSVSIQLLYAVSPLQTLLIIIGTTLISAGMIIGALVGAVGLVLLAHSYIGLSLNRDRPIVYALLFLAVSAVGTAMTPYGPSAIANGAVSLCAMLAMIAMALVVVRMLAQAPHLFRHLVRIMAISAGMMGLTVLLQFFIANVLRMPALFDLTALNALWGGFKMWPPAAMTGFIRPRGLYLEPVYLAGFVGMASGVAMIRLGAFGPALRQSLVGIVPGWAAFSIVASQILSVSSTVYAALFVTFVAALASSTHLRWKSMAKFVVGTVMAIGFAIGLAFQAGDIVVDRIADLFVFQQLANIDALVVGDNPVGFTAMVLFANSYVALQNLIANPLLGAGVGAHPFAYDVLSFVMPEIFEYGRGISSADSGALIIRLLSETGILGTLIFSAAIFSAWYRGRRTILMMGWDASNPERNSFKAQAIGVSGAMIGVYAGFLIHIAHYYEPPFWTLFALCVAIPAVANSYGSVRGHTGT